MGLFVKQLRELANQDKKIGGEKATDLGSLFLAGFPIPLGFVVTSEAFRAHIRSTGIDKRISDALRGSDPTLASESAQVFILNTDICEEVKKEILAAYSDMSFGTAYGVDPKARELITSGRDLPCIAVRRSIIGEFGQSKLASSINVKGRDELLSAVKKCWASIFIPERIKSCEDLYGLSTSVLIQKFVDSTKSGLVFTQNPKTSSSGEMFILSGHGLGIPLIKKEVEADEFIIDKSTGIIKVRKPGNRNWKLVKDGALNFLKRVPLSTDELNSVSLSDRELEVLSKLARNLEAHAGEPQVFEWAIEGHRVYLLQTKPQSKVTSSRAELGPSFDTEVFNAPRVSKTDFFKPVEQESSFGILPDPFKQDSAQFSSVIEGPKVQEQQAPAFEPIDLFKPKEPRVNPLLGMNEEPSNSTMGMFHFDEDEASKLAPRAEQIQSPQNVFSPSPPVFAPSPVAKQVAVKAIIDLPMYADRVAHSADGVGLLKLESVILNRGIHPDKLARQGRQDEHISLLVQTIASVADAFRGKPVSIKLSDLSTEDLRRLDGGDAEPYEKVPLVGARGVRRIVSNPSLLNFELQALRRVLNLGYKTLSLVIPFVTDASEVRQIRDVLRVNQIEVGRDLKLGVSVETPAAAWVIKDLCNEGVHFVSVDLDRLSERILAIDKDNPSTRGLYKLQHPAIKDALSKIVSTCKDFGVEVDVHGSGIEEIASYLKGLGVDSISSGIDNLEKVRQALSGSTGLSDAAFSQLFS